MGRQRDQRQARRARALLLVRADQACGLEAVHLRHLDVHEHDVEGAREHRGHRLPPVVHERGAMSLALEEAQHQRSVHEVVLGDEDIQRPQLRREIERLPPGRRGARQAERSSGGLREGRGERERGAGAGLALDPELAAHQRDELRRDRQPEPRPAVLPRGRAVGLRERLEDELLLVLRDADAGVLHGHHDTRLLLVLALDRDADHHAAPFGELDGVREEVDEDLPEAEWIADQRARDVGREVVLDREALLLRAQGDGAHAVVEHLLDLESHRLEIEPTGLDLREIEDVVDEGEERVGRGPHHL